MTVKYKHEWDLLTDFCIHCGVRREQHVNKSQGCHREENVTAISHIRSKIRTKEPTHKMKKSRKKHDRIRTPAKN